MPYLLKKEYTYKNLGGIFLECPPPPAAPAPAAPAPAAPAAPPPPALQGMRRAYSVGVNWQNLRQQLGGPPPPAAGAPPPAAGAAPAPAPAAPPGPQGERRSYTVGFDFSRSQQQLGQPPAAPAAGAAPAAPGPAPRPIANLNMPQPARPFPPRLPLPIKEAPVVPSLIERIYYNNGNPSKKEQVLITPRDSPGKAGSPLDLHRPPPKLDTPPGEELCEPSGEYNDDDAEKPEEEEEEEQEDDEERRN
ncbi:vegetative cell wall protein gp1-like [Sitophilus oryzae]|uniref:Vegetative cell wall protein gp1-like n=1 Tax=Sitophilus oryzae TaxID=7048 RepID=A0A6J2X2P5_SITOR|nr:vegetative cell wall protein gp1-like [Sitophilus oryzae]